MKFGVHVGLCPGHIVLDGDPAPAKGAQPPIFGPCLLWPNGWMDQDAIWYGGRPWHRRHCARLRPSSPKKGHSPQFSADVCCGQTAVCIRIPLGTEVGLRRRHCVRWVPSRPASDRAVDEPIPLRCPARYQLGSRSQSSSRAASIAG